MLQEASIELAPTADGANVAPTSHKAFDAYQVTNHGEFGRKVVRWAVHPETRPKTMEELRAQAGDDVYLPSALTSFEFVQGSESKIVIYLPPVFKLKEAEARLAAVKTSGDVQKSAYPLPDFYAAVISGVLTDVDEILYSRIGDYSVGGCR